VSDASRGMRTNYVCGDVRKRQSVFGNRGSVIMVRTADRWGRIPAASSTLPTFTSEHRREAGEHRERERDKMKHDLAEDRLYE